MRKKPKGRKYRNLYARGDVIWFEKLVRGRRTRRSCKTGDWDMAAAVREEWERQSGASRSLTRSTRASSRALLSGWAVGSARPSGAGLGS